MAQAGENNRAAGVLTQGAAHFAGAPFVQKKFDEAARALGMDVFDPSVEANAANLAGPTADDVAAIGSLPQAEQDDLIEGMVAGLAAQLEQEPGNPEKWIMLVRSYAVLGDFDKAEAAYETAKAHFADNAAVLDMMAEGLAGVLGY